MVARARLHQAAVHDALLDASGDLLAKPVAYSLAVRTHTNHTVPDDLGEAETCSRNFAYVRFALELAAASVRAFDVLAQLFKDSLHVVLDLRVHQRIRVNVGITRRPGHVSRGQGKQVRSVPHPRQSLAVHEPLPVFGSSGHEYELDVLSLHVVVVRRCLRL